MHFIPIAHGSDTMLNLPGRRNPSYCWDYVYGICLCLVYVCLLHAHVCSGSCTVCMCVKIRAVHWLCLLWLSTWSPWDRFSQWTRWKSCLANELLGCTCFCLILGWTSGNGVHGLFPGVWGFESRSLCSESERSYLISAIPKVNRLHKMILTASLYTCCNHQIT